MTSEPDEHSTLEVDKLREEVANLRAELRKKPIEIERAELELTKLRRDLRFGWRIVAFLGGLTPVTALVLAFISGVTLFLNWRSEIERRELEEFRRITNEIASDSAAVRAGAAAQLGSIACCGEMARRSEAQAILLSAVGNEQEFNARHALQSALLLLRISLLPALTEYRAELERELRTAFGRGQRPTCASFDTALARFRAMQEGLVTLAVVKSKLTGSSLDLQRAPFRCASLIGFDAKDSRFAGAILWQADLSRAVLSGSDFTDAQLDETDLSEADISGARFCGDHTSGLELKMVQLTRGWQTALYPAAFAAKLEAATRVRVRVCPSEAAQSKAPSGGA